MRYNVLVSIRTDRWDTIQAGNAEEEAHANSATYVNGKRAYGNATGNWLDSKLVKYDVVTAQLMKSDASSNVAYPSDGVRKSIYYTPAKLVKITKSTIATLKKA